MRPLEKTCTISQLVTRLTQIKKEHGDLLVWLDDPDTSWRLPIGLQYKPMDIANNWPERVEIKSNYHIRPSGDFYMMTTNADSPICRSHLYTMLRFGNKNPDIFTDCEHEDCEHLTEDDVDEIIEALNFYRAVKK